MGTVNVAGTVGANTVNLASLVVGGDVVFEGAAESAKKISESTAAAAVQIYNDPTGTAKTVFAAGEKALYNFSEKPYAERLATSFELGLDIATIFAPFAKGSAATKAADLLGDAATDASKLNKVLSKADEVANIINKVDTPPIDTKVLIQRIANKAEQAVEGSGRLAGIKKHKYAERLLRKYQKLFNKHTSLLAEEPWLNKAMVKNRPLGSAAPDVFDLSTGIIYDYKFVKNPGKGLSKKQINNNLKNVRGVVDQIEINPTK